MPILTAKQHEHVIWRTIKAHYEKRLEELRKANDKSDPDPIKDQFKTAARRAQIEEIKSLINDDAPQLDKRGGGQPFE